MVGSPKTVSIIAAVRIFIRCPMGLLVSPVFIFGDEPRAAAAGGGKEAGVRRKQRSISRFPGGFLLLRLPGAAVDGSE